MIEASQSMISEQNNPIINEHFKLQIKTLQNAPRDIDKLERLLTERKEKGKGRSAFREFLLERTASIVFSI
jgi:hypothetical protein